MMTSHYEKVKSIGQGGMATVFEATDRRLNRRVAIKELAESLAENERHSVLFLSEARKMSSVNHPNVVQIFDVEDDEKQPRIIMELAEGTFQDYLSSGPCEPVMVERVARHVLQGLEAIHQAHIIHRDVKPANILYFPSGFFKIGDFGIATDGEDHTQLLATPKYMAPEVLTRPHLVGPASDLYSLGLVLYEALLGSPRFTETVERTAGEETAPADPSRPRPDGRHLWQVFHGGRAELPLLHEISSEIPEPLSRWIAKLTRKDIAERFASAKEALHALDHGAIVGTGSHLYDADMTQRIDPNQAKKGLSGLQIGLIVALVLVLAGGAAFFVLRGPKRLPVQISSDPSGAAILFEGTEVGHTSLLEKMRPGASVTIQLEGFESTDLTLSPDAEPSGTQPIPLHAVLEWSLPVQITSQPPGAEITLAEITKGEKTRGEEVIGTTPHDLRGRGSEVKVSLKLEGYDPVSRTIEPGDSSLAVELLPSLPDEQAASSPGVLAEALTPFLTPNGGTLFELESKDAGVLHFGEALRLKTKAAADVHAALFLLQSTGDALLLYPSPRAGSLRLGGDQETSLPLPKHARRGYRLLASEPEGRDLAFLLLSPEPLKPPPVGETVGQWSQLFPSSADAGESALDLLRWAAEVRRERFEDSQLLRLDIQVER